MFSIFNALFYLPSFLHPSATTETVGAKVRQWVLGKHFFFHSISTTWKHQKHFFLSQLLHDWYNFFFLIFQGQKGEPGDIVDVSMQFITLSRHVHHCVKASTVNGFIHQLATGLSASLAQRTHDWFHLISLFFFWDSWMSKIVLIHARNLQHHTHFSSSYFVEFGVAVSFLN